MDMPTSTHHDRDHNAALHPQRLATATALSVASHDMLGAAIGRL